MATRMVNTVEATSRLSELIRDAESGTEVVVTRNGRPVARIVPWRAGVRTPGIWSGRVEYHDDIVDPDADVIETFDQSLDRP